MKDFSKALLDLDLWIREGRHDEAKSLFFQLVAEAIPRRYLFEFTAMARRLSVPHVGVTLLAPIVRPKARSVEQATAAELSEYAGCLIRMGGVSEALRLLEDVRIADYPRSLLLRGFGHLSIWDYKTANELLKDYILLPGLEPYEILVAKVNMAYGHIFLDELHEAQVLLEELLVETSKEGRSYLKSTVLEFCAHTQILLGHWKTAEEYLVEAEKLLSRSDTIDAYLIRKERAILELLKDSSEKNKIKIMSVKNEGLHRSRFESVRDCDYYLALAFEDKNLARHLYFGTPHKSYKEKIKKTFLDFDFTGSHDFVLGSDRKPIRLKQESHHVHQRLLQVLSNDFYKPKNLMDLFDNLYPNEYYSESVPDKIHQALRRLRMYLSEQKIPLKIISGPDGFFLEPVKNRSVVIECQKNFDSSEITKNKLQKWIGALDAKNYSIQDITQLLKMPRRSAQREVALAVTLGLITRSGAGPTTSYSPAKKN